MQIHEAEGELADKLSYKISLKKYLIQNINSREIELVADGYESDSSLNNECLKVFESFKKMQKDYEEKVIMLATQLKELRKKCKHKLTTYDSCPAGGRGETSCDVCGKSGV